MRRRIVNNSVRVVYDRSERIKLFAIHYLTSFITGILVYAALNLVIVIGGAIAFVTVIGFFATGDLLYAFQQTISDAREVLEKHYTTILLLIFLKSAIQYLKQENPVKAYKEFKKKLEEIEV